MYQISLKGYFETENPDKFLEDLQKVIKDDEIDLIGQFQVYKLAPYVDYQKADVSDASD